MFYFFRGNHLWSQATLRMLFTGGSIGEVAAGVEALQPAAAESDEQEWHRVWRRFGDRLWARAEAEADKGHEATAQESYLRACVYYQWSIAFRDHNDQSRRDTHVRSVEAFARFGALHEPRIERVEVPYDNSSFPAWFVPATGGERGAVAMYLPGWDSTKEQGVEFAREASRRGLHVLLCDGPGIGEAVLFRGMVNRFDYEVPVRAAMRYLATRPDVDHRRIGVVGSSMGGYRAARAAAREADVAAAVVWGAIWDFGTIWERNLKSPGSSLPTPLLHALRVMGASTLDEVTRLMPAWTLEGVADGITCPLLVMHGEDDVQIPLADALMLFNSARSSNKELKIFTSAEGGSAHCQNDNRILAHQYIGDWLADVLLHGRERTGIIGMMSN